MDVLMTLDTSRYPVLISGNVETSQLLTFYVALYLCEMPVSGDLCI